MARSTAADDAGSEDSEYKVAASEDSESDEAFAAPKGKPNPGGIGKKLQCKGKVSNKTAAIQAKDPPLQRNIRLHQTRYVLHIF